LEDGGSRRFIAVQLPEPCDSSTTAFKEGYETIAEIAKERLRRVHKKYSIVGSSLLDQNVDSGFRAFKLSSSNILPWDSSGENFEHNLLSAAESIKPDRSDFDVVFELIVKSGLDLSVPCEDKEADGISCFCIGYGAMWVCLADELSSAHIEAIVKHCRESTAQAVRVVLKDNSFKNDVDKTNALQALANAGISDVKTI
jgi:adenine-specific DNA-methyltransferase